MVFLYFWPSWRTELKVYLSTKGGVRPYVTTTWTCLETLLPSSYRNAPPHPSPYRTPYRTSPPPGPAGKRAVGLLLKSFIVTQLYKFFICGKVFIFSVSKTNIRPQLRKLVFRSRKTPYASKVEVTLHYTGDTRSFLLSTAAHSMSMSFVNLTESCTIKLYISPVTMSLFGKITLIAR